MKRIIGKLFILSVAALVVKYFMFTPINNNDPNDAIIKTIEAFFALIASIIFSVWYNTRRSKRKAEEQFQANSTYRDNQYSMDNGSSSSIIVMVLAAIVVIGGMVLLAAVGPTITSLLALPGATGFILLAAMFIKRICK